MNGINLFAALLGSVGVVLVFGTLVGGAETVLARLGGKASQRMSRWRDEAADPYRVSVLEDRALLDRGGMSPAALQRARVRQALHIVLPLFEWRDGEFRFFEGEAPQGELPGVDLPIPGIVAAGIRALRDPGLFAERIPSLDRVYEAIASDGGSSVAVALRPVESFILKLVNGSRTIDLEKRQAIAEATNQVVTVGRPSEGMTVVVLIGPSERGLPAHFAVSREPGQQTTSLPQRKVQKSLCYGGR